MQVFHRATGAPEHLQSVFICKGFQLFNSHDALRPAQEAARRHCIKNNKIYFCF